METNAKNMNIGKGIKEIRIQRKLKQKELAELIGISRTSMTMIEKGHKEPSKKNLLKICDSLQTNPITLHFYSIEEKDVPEFRKEVYKELYPSIKKMINTIFNN